eukprot:2389193-Alexandrium_andersonii.AAC.1
MPHQVGGQSLYRLGAIPVQMLRPPRGGAGLRAGRPPYGHAGPLATRPRRWPCCPVGTPRPAL